MSRKSADNYINLSRWYVAHFDDGRADKESHLAAIQQNGGRCEFRHDGFTSFNAVYELLSKRARKVKAALKPAKKGKATPKPEKPQKLTQKQQFILLRNDNQKLVQVVQSLDPQHPVLAEVNMSILPEGKPTLDVGKPKRSGGSPAQNAMKGKKETVTPSAIPEYVGQDRLAG